jgi:hypothetical protein
MYRLLEQKRINIDPREFNIHVDAFQAAMRKVNAFIGRACSAGGCIPLGATTIAWDAGVDHTAIAGRYPVDETTQFLRDVWAVNRAFVALMESKNVRVNTTRHSKYNEFNKVRSNCIRLTMKHIGSQAVTW